MKVATPGHVYQAELLGGGCSKKELHLKETAFHKAFINFLEKAMKIVTNRQVTALILTMWAIVSPLLYYSCCVMLVTSLKPNFSIDSQCSSFSRWLTWTLKSDCRSTKNTSAAEVNGGKCFENIKYYTSVSNFSSQAGPVVSSGDRWVSSNGTITYSKYSHVMAQDTTGSRTTWIIESGTYRS